MRRAIAALDQPCAVVGSRPSVPVDGMESALGQKILWLDANKPISWSDLQLRAPKVYFQSGWRYPAFAALGDQVKRAGGRVVGLSDANWRGDMRQLMLGASAFRLSYRRRFDAMMVPGRQGARLMRWFGVAASRIRQGMYGADPVLYGDPPPLASRPKTFLFVGQFIPRKDVVGLARAFLRIENEHPGWKLHLIGGGEQRNLIPKHPSIIVEDFVQPRDLVARFHAARFLVLPSRREAWGVVVHEATLAGCGLILSDRVGSAEDLSTPANALYFRAGRPTDLARALSTACRKDEAWLSEASATSRRLAASFGPERFGREAAQLVAELSRG
jgi:glycosyltransferase involved in cell wall biosynthesis